MLIRLIIFLAVNFLALYLGQIFTDAGVSSQWYADLNKAPWTPPGWVFGFSWVTIMICFSIFMAFAWDVVKNINKLLMLFIVQFFLNVGWNPVFFYYNNTQVALAIIITLTIFVAYFFFNYRRELESKSFLMLPYLIWLIIATSLNAYVV
jgi:tryptophan-rich sensory protein